MLVLVMSCMDFSADVLQYSAVIGGRVPTLQLLTGMLSQRSSWSLSLRGLALGELELRCDGVV